MEDYNERVWKEWLAKVMLSKPKGNKLLDSKRGIEVTKLMLDCERKSFNWRRGDWDAFWIDVQMAVKYKLTDTEIRFMMRQQPGITNHDTHKEERNAYAEMMRGMEKLMKIQFPEAFTQGSVNKEKVAELLEVAK